jgi:hypothetical protein
VSEWANDVESLAADVYGNLTGSPNQAPSAGGTSNPDFFDGLVNVARGGFDTVRGVWKDLTQFELERELADARIDILRTNNQIALTNAQRSSAGGLNMNSALPVILLGLGIVAVAYAATR